MHMMHTFPHRKNTHKIKSINLVSNVINGPGGQHNVDHVLNMCQALQTCT